jgi:hypothetical protein
VFISQLLDALMLLRRNSIIHCDLSESLCVFSVALLIRSFSEVWNFPLSLCLTLCSAGKHTAGERGASADQAD